MKLDSNLTVYFNSKKSIYIFLVKKSQVILGVLKKKVGKLMRNGVRNREVAI